MSEIEAVIQEQPDNRPVEKEQSIQPITLDLIRSLHGYEKSEALIKYHEWQAKVRKEDRHQLAREKANIDRFMYIMKYPERAEVYKIKYNTRMCILNTNNLLVKERRKKHPNNRRIGELLLRRKKHENRLMIVQRKIKKMIKNDI
jgi:hypothetical protein